MSRLRVLWNLGLLLGLVVAWVAALAVPATGQPNEVPAEEQGTYEGEMANTAGQPVDANTVRIEVGGTSSSGSIDFLFGGAGLFCTGVTWEWDNAYASFDVLGPYIRGTGTYRNEPCQSFDPQPAEFELHLLLGGDTATGQLYNETGFVGGFDIPRIDGATDSGGDEEDPGPIIAVVGGIAAVTAAVAAASGTTGEDDPPPDDEKPKRDLAIVQVSANLLEINVDDSAQLTLTGWLSGEKGVIRVPMQLWIVVPPAQGVKVTPDNGTGELKATVAIDEATYDETVTEVTIVAHGSWDGHEATADIKVKLGSDYVLRLTDGGSADSG